MRIFSSQASTYDVVPIGDAIDALPWETHLDIAVIEATWQEQCHDGEKPIPARAWEPFEFVRFLTEQNGRMVHVWKRTK